MKWPQVALPRVTEINPRRPRDLGVSNEELVSFVPMAAVSELSASVARLETRPYAEVSRGFTYFAEDDVLFAKITPCMENGKSALARGLRTGFGFGSTEFHVLRAQKRLLLPEYLHYFIRQEAFRSAAKTRMRGAAGQQRVPASFLEETLLPLPTLTEQRRIVEILDQADALRQQRRAADEKAQRIIPALFYHMFGDPIGNPLGFPVEPVGELLVVLRNGTTTDQNQEGRGYPVTRIETISAGVIDPERVRYVDLDEADIAKWRLEPGDILFSHINSESHIGKTAIYQGHPSPLIHGMNLLLMRPDKGKVRPEFLFAVLNSPSVRDTYRQRCKRAVNQASLNQKDISGLLVAVPPLDEQDRFCACAEKLLVQLDAQRQTRERVVPLYDNLLYRAFTGELTANWREAHREELEAEMQAQAQALADPAPRSSDRGRKRRSP